MVDIYLYLGLALISTSVYCSMDKAKSPLEGRGMGFEIPHEAKIGVLRPCDDVEYEFSHVCPHIFWFPGGRIDPRNEIRVGAHLSMPFELGEGSTLITLKVEGEPIFEDRLDFTCELILSARDYIPFPYQCPIAVTTNVTFSYTFTDVLGLKAYPGEYEIDLRLKNIDGYGVCCTANIAILG